MSRGAKDKPVPASFASPWMSMAHACAMLDCSRDTVRRRIKARELHARCLHGRWEVWRVSVHEYLMRGAPPKQVPAGFAMEEDTLGLYSARGR